SPSSPSPSGHISNSRPDAVMGARNSGQIPAAPPAPPITYERPNPAGNHNTPVITPYGPVSYQQSGTIPNPSGNIPSFTPGPGPQYNPQYNPVTPPPATFPPQ